MLLPIGTRRPFSKSRTVETAKIGAYDREVARQKRRHRALRQMSLRKTVKQKDWRA
jgi:hypothetical protein